MEQIKGRLNGVRPRALLAFGAMVCERMYPNYVAFERQQTWGNSSVLRWALDAVWTMLLNDRLEVAVVRQHLASCEEAIPSTDDFPGTSASMALDSATAICDLLDGVETGPLEKVAEICTLAIDSVDRHIQFEDLSSRAAITPADELFIAEHPLMQAELQRQEDQLAKVVGAERFDRDTLTRLKVEAQQAKLFELTS